MIDFGRRVDRVQINDGFERRRVLAVRRPQRNLAEVVHGADLVFGILHGQHVAVAGLRIDPEAGGDHRVGSERRDDVIDYVLRSNAQADWRFPD